MAPDKAGNERDKLKRHIRWHKITTPLAIGVAISAIGLCGWVVANQRTFISPPVIQHGYWIASQEADKQYIEDMADYVLTSLYTVTPANADYRSKRILKMVKPEDYGAMSAKFQAAVEKLKREGLSTVWEPQSVGVAEGSLCAKWTGNLKRMVGEKLLDPQTKTFLVEFDIDRHGTLYVKTADEFSPELAAVSHCQ